MRAREILTARWPIVSAVTKVIYEKGGISRDDLLQMMGCENEGRHPL